MVKDILDQAVKTCSSFKSMQELIDSFIADCKKYNTENSSTGWNEFLKEKCGIDIALTSRGCGQYMIKYISGEVECHMN